MKTTDFFKAVAFVMTVIIAAKEAHAEAISGNDLHAACSAEDAPVMSAACSFYSISALENMKWGAAVALMALANGELDTNEVDGMANALLGFCVPPEVSNEQLRDVVAAYLDSNPSTRHYPARGLIHQALRASFPCEEAPAE